MFALIGAEPPSLPLLPPAIWPVAAPPRQCHIPTTRHIVLEHLLMAESTNPLVAFSDHAAQLVEHTASSIVAVHGGGRVSSSGIHWRSGVIVTAAEVLERDEDIKITLPGGRVAEASLAGRDPTRTLPCCVSSRTDCPRHRPPMRHPFAPVTSFWQSEIARVRRSQVAAA